MDVKAVVEAGGHGLDTVIDNVAKLRSVLPEEARQIADSAVGTDVAAMLTAAGERAEVAKAKAAEAAEAAKAKAAEAAEAAMERAAEVAEAARERSSELAEASAEAAGEGRSRLPVVLGAVAVTGAAAAAAVLVWRRRQAAAARELSGEVVWESFSEVTHTDSVADDQSPETADPHLAEEIDEIADEIAEEFVEALTVVEAELDVAEAQSPAEPFVAGVADEQGPESADPSFADEVDAAADALAQGIVDAIEEPKKD
jgi:hypothetical protein